MTYEEQLRAQEGKPVTVRLSIPITPGDGIYDDHCATLNVTVLGASLPDGSSFSARARAQRESNIASAVLKLERALQDLLTPPVGSGG